jgi:hypothetical protein
MSNTSNISSVISPDVLRTVSASTVIKTFGDQLKDKDSIELNIPGPPSENFEDFEPGVDYFEGITQDQEISYKNLVWVQYRWDNRNMLYYIDDEGRLTQRINQGYAYPTGTSS